jgi:hypothetical protein
MTSGKTMLHQTIRATLHAHLLATAMLLTSCGNNTIAVAPPARHPVVDSLRREAINSTIQDIETELQKQGSGDWDKWGDNVEPFLDTLASVARDSARKCVEGLDGFLFWTHSFRVHSRRDLVGDTSPESPIRSIKAFSKALRNDGIDLIVVPVPDKIAVYPDKFAPGKLQTGANPSVQMMGLVLDLCRRDVEAVDLYTLFHSYRRDTGDTSLLYYRCDSHYRPVAFALVANEIARRLARYRQIGIGSSTPIYRTELIAVDAPCDLLGHATPSVNRCQPIDTACRVLTVAGVPYAADDSARIVLGSDSFGTIMADKAANVGALIAARVGAPLAYASGSMRGPWVPLLFYRRPAAFRANKRVVVWIVADRQFNSDTWPVVGSHGLDRSRGGIDSRGRP